MSEFACSRAVCRAPLGEIRGRHRDDQRMYCEACAGKINAACADLRPNGVIVLEHVSCPSSGCVPHAFHHDHASCPLEE